METKGHSSCPEVNKQVLNLPNNTPKPAVWELTASEKSPSNPALYCVVEVNWKYTLAYKSATVLFLDDSSWGATSQIEVYRAHVSLS